MGRERENENFSTDFWRRRKLKSFFFRVSVVVEECCAGVEEANLISMSVFPGGRWHDFCDVSKHRRLFLNESSVR